MATSPSKWTINEATYGKTLDELVFTQPPAWNLLGLPLPEPSGYQSRPVDDFSPDFADDGTGIVKVIPFSELDNVVEDGDVVIFMDDKTKVASQADIMKQRGCHGEIAFRDEHGKAVQCAPWNEVGGEIEDRACCDQANDRHYNDGSDWNLHFFRISRDSGKDGQIKGLLSGVRLWRRIFHHYTFPPGNWQLDPVDFTTPKELDELACHLIRKEPAPNMTCIQWVHAVLSLALNVPLNRRTLTQLGVVDTYDANWASDLGCLDDNVEPLALLPINPYSPLDLIRAVCKLYAEMSDQCFDELLPKIEPLIAAHPEIPRRTINPIAPFTEYRKPGHTGNVKWEYVATAFNDKYCRLK